MLFLSENENKSWIDLAGKVKRSAKSPFPVSDHVRPGLIPAFHYFIGTILLSEGNYSAGGEWIKAGMAGEQGGLFSNAFLMSYLGRNNGRFVIPETIFADPAPYIHFAGTPVLTDSRVKFRTHCVHTLPAYRKPLRIMDIGCGHGQVLIDLLGELLIAGNITGIDEILLIDPSEGMLKLARENVERAFPSAKVVILNARIEALSESIDGYYDLALSSLAYHHMPFETKLFHLKKLNKQIGGFILFELDANNDTPDLHTPALALSVYQSYGALMDFIFAHDGSIEVAVSSIDKFLMSEAIYFFTHPRGKRTDYHMLRAQWHDLFTRGLGSDFSCMCDSTCFGDENMALFTMIFLKN